MRKASILLFACSISMSPIIGHAAGWTSEMSIVSLNTEASSDLVYLTVSPAVTYATGCDANNWMITSNTEARAQRFYSTLMSAMLAGKKVRFWYADTCATWGYHNATSVKIVN
jgi:hypothetical protein